MLLSIRNHADLDAYLRSIEAATAKAIDAVSAARTPNEALRRMKFEPIGWHPIEGHALNLIEQVNQTFTYLVALKAASWLLDHHPEARGFDLDPGAGGSLAYDIMSVEPDVVAAETFAAVDPGNNRKLQNDLQKLGSATSRFRYVFFYSPGYTPGRCPQLERRSEIEVHCVDI